MIAPNENDYNYSYIVAYADSLSGLAIEVQKQHAAGYKTVGGIAVSSGIQLLPARNDSPEITDTYYYQAMQRGEVGP